MKRLLTATLLCTLLVSGLGIGGASAVDPVAAKRAEADRIARQLDTLAREASILTEQLNQARLRADRVEADAAGAEAAAAAAELAADQARTALRRHAVEAYMAGGFVSLSAGLNTDDAAEAITGQQYLSVIAKGKADAIDALRAATLAHREKQAELDRARLAARQALDAVDARRGRAATAVSAERRVLAQVQGELAGMVEAERARRAAEEARKAQELASRRSQEEAQRRAAAPRPTAPPANPSKPPPATRPTSPSAPPPPAASGASGAVEEAKRHLGKPYEYGASGPERFDCSGLTSYAWRHGGGKSLPHSSKAQYSSTARVSMDDIAPGDLLFYGPDPGGIHHVGIYVGGGQMIEAPETGKNVRYASIHRRDLVGIGRVR